MSENVSPEIRQFEEYCKETKIPGLFTCIDVDQPRGRPSFDYLTHTETAQSQDLLNLNEASRLLNELILSSVRLKFPVVKKPRKRAPVTIVTLVCHVDNSQQITQIWLPSLLRSWVSASEPLKVLVLPKIPSRRIKLANTPRSYIMNDGLSRLSIPASIYIGYTGALTPVYRRAIAEALYYFSLLPLEAFSRPPKLNVIKIKNIGSITKGNFSTDQVVSQLKACLEAKTAWE